MAGAHRKPAHIHRIRAGQVSRGVTTPVPRVYLPVSLTGPDPSGSPGPTQLCRGCSHHPQRSPGTAASSFPPTLRRQGDEGLSPPSESSEVDPERGTGLTTDPFLRVASRTRRAPLSAPGSPQVPWVS